MIMKKLYFLTVFTVLIFAFGNMSYAQDSIEVSNLQKDTSTNTWHLYTQINDVDIYYQYVDCGPFEFVYFKIENNSTQILNVSWDFEFINNGELIPINPDDSSIQFTINPNQSINGQCKTNQYFGLCIYVKEPNTPARLTMIKLNNINVTL